MAQTAAQKRDFGELCKCKEKIFRGVPVSGGGAALGRLYTPEAAAVISPRESCILCLLEQRDLETAERRASALAPLGVILSSCVISPELLNFLIASRLPYLIVREGFSRAVMGRIALLDAQKDILIVDPDLDTLNFYAEDNRISQAALLERAFLEQSGSFGLLLKREKGGKSALVRGIEDISSAELFDALLDITEELCGLSLTVGIDLLRVNGSFCERIEAIFRAAVYGDISLQFENFRSDNDISRALKLLHGVFCSLEGEDREFNGYLKRGLLISFPLWLTQSSPQSRPDFLCFDFDRLTAHLLGCEAEELADCLPKREIFAVWENYFSRFAPKCELRAESKMLADSPLFHEWCELAGVVRVYT